MEISIDKLQNNSENNANRVDEEYEFMMPLSATNKLKPFVDRYFIKYYKPFPCSFDSSLNCNQYAFLHTNK
jgi:hypothetical protein